MGTFNKLNPQYFIQECETEEIQVNELAFRRAEWFELFLKHQEVVNSIENEGGCNECSN